MEQGLTTYQDQLEDQQGTTHHLNVVPNGSYPTLSPILQLHLRRLWITGMIASIEDGVSSVTRLDSRVDPFYANKYLSDNINSEEWISERNATLRDHYVKMVKDSERLRTSIDLQYEKVFSKITELTVAKLNRFSQLVEEDPDSKQVAPTQLQKLTNIAKTSYLMQRLARGMSTGNSTLKVEKPDDPDYPELKEVIIQYAEESVELKDNVLDPE